MASLRAAPVAAPLAERAATLARFETLVGRLATFCRLSPAQRARFIKDAEVREVPAGARLETHGEKASSAEVEALPRSYADA